MPRDDWDKARAKRPIRPGGVYYCYECLVVFNWKQLPPGNTCPKCSCALSRGERRIVTHITESLAIARGTATSGNPSEQRTYWNSRQWKTIRRRVLERDSYSCTCCGKRAETVHHRSYDREVLSGKRDADLVSLCGSCHKEIEFTINEQGKQVKNCLRIANEKLDAAIARRTARSSEAVSRQDARELDDNHVPVAQVRGANNASEMTPTKH